MPILRGRLLQGCRGIAGREALPPSVRHPGRPPRPRRRPARDRRGLTLATALVLLLGAGWPSPARADRIDTLVLALRGDSSFKVRVQAALTLGKLRDRKAVPALGQALSGDANAAVRAAAAAALGAIGDKKAEDALATAASVDKESIVRNEARKALGRLSTGGGAMGGGGGGGGGKVFVSLGNMGNAAGPSAAPLTRLLKEYLRRELQGTSRVSLSPGGTKKSYYLDGSITKLTKSGGELTLEVRLVVATYPSKSIVMMTSGGATVEGGGSFNDMAKDALENAVKGVHQNFLTFLQRQ